MVILQSSSLYLLSLVAGPPLPSRRSLELVRRQATTWRHAIYSWICSIYSYRPYSNSVCIYVREVDRSLFSLQSFNNDVIWWFLWKRVINYKYIILRQQCSKRNKIIIKLAVASSVDVEYWYRLTTTVNTHTHTHHSSTCLLVFME